MFKETKEHSFRACLGQPGYVATRCCNIPSLLAPSRYPMSRFPTLPTWLQSSITNSPSMPIVTRSYDHQYYQLRSRYPQVEGSVDEVDSIDNLVRLKQANLDNFWLRQQPALVLYRLWHATVADHALINLVILRHPVHLKSLQTALNHSFASHFSIPRGSTLHTYFEFGLSLAQSIRRSRVRHGEGEDRGRRPPIVCGCNR
jgi:hypothetical protein